MPIPSNIISKFPKLSKEKLLNHLKLPVGKNKLILDTDTANEIDDQFALTWALLSKDKIDLLGVTAEPYSFQHHKEELLEAYNIIKLNKEITNENNELIMNYKNWVTCIILSATIIDVINYEESGPILRIVGLDKNSLFSNSETYWLRQKRNSILHYQKPVSGLMNEKNASSILEMDAKRSSMILLNILKVIGDEV